MSDQDKNIFQGGNDQTPSANTPSVNTDAASTLLAQFKNERGEQKYKTVEDALNALAHSQNFISTLVNEKRELESKFNEIKPVADKVVQLENTVSELLNKGTAQPPAGITEEQIATHIERTLTQREQQQIAQNNIKSVVATLRETLGDDAEKTFYGKAEELGMTKAEINALAARTPKAVLKMLGIEDRKIVQSGSPPNTSSINTTSLEPNKQTFITRNSKKLSVGATTQELHEESANARRMVDELHSQGKSIDDLTKPSVYFKTFR